MDGSLADTRRPLQLFGLALLFLLSACASRQAPTTNPAAAAQSLPGDEPLQAQIVQYVQVQQALASDDFSAARIALEELITVADTTTAPLARSAAGADDIERMRAKFKPLSEYLAAQELPEGYGRAYCPMYDGGTNWVQTDGPVRNPFYGSAMLTCGVVDSAPGAHMDHGPRHGGTVFMAPDSFHHIEGAYSDTGLFRLYATDNYRDPVDVSDWSGRAVLEEEYDPDTDEFNEVVAIELIPSPDGPFLGAMLDLPVPAEITAKVLFGIDEEEFPEERFDFIFAEYSVDGGEAPDRDPSLVSTNPASGALPLSARIQPEIPALTSDLVAEIDARAQQLQNLITAGRFTEVFIPALQGKELALALEAREEIQALSERDRNELRIAVRHIVRAAYLLDWYGDLGNKQQVSGAYDVFADAVGQLTRAYARIP